MMPLRTHVLRMGQSPFPRGRLRGIFGTHKLHLLQRGFTMLEILASIAIMAIVVLPLLGLIASTPAIHMKKEQQVRASFLAELRLEEVKNKIKIESDLGTFDTADYNKATGSSTDFTTGEGFKPSDAMYKYTISHDEDENIKTIIVEVWYDEDGSNGDGPNGTETSVILGVKVARRR